MNNQNNLAFAGTINLNTLTSRARCLTETPISLHNDNGSFLNYDLEQGYLSRGFNGMWTDAEENKTKVNDLFAFVIGGGTSKNKPCRVEIHEVVAILPNNCARKDWTGAGTFSKENHENGKRNVLVIGPKLVTLEWEVYAQMMGQQPYSPKSIGDPSNPQRSPVQRTVSRKIKI